MCEVSIVKGEHVFDYRCRGCKRRAECQKLPVPIELKLNDPC